MSKKKFNDDHSVPSGRVLFRTWLYSGSRDGDDFRYSELGNDVVPVKETRCYVPRATSESDTKAERLERELQYQAAVSSLTAIEQEVLRFQGKLQRREEVRLTITAGDLVEYQRDGYTLIPGSAHDVERAGMSPLNCVIVVGYETVQVESLDYKSIAERLGVSIHQVHRAVKSANKKMRGHGC